MVCVRTVRQIYSDPRDELEGIVHNQLLHFLLYSLAFFCGVGSVTSSGGSVHKERMEDEEEGEKDTLPLGHGRLLRSRGRRKDSMDERKDRREKDPFKSKKKTRKSCVLEEMENDEMNSSQAMEFIDGG